MLGLRRARASCSAQLIAICARGADVIHRRAITDRHRRHRSLWHAGRSRNLLLIGSAGGVPVLGAPGCARSPIENGFDWVLMRLLAGLKVSRADLTGMGVGGLLMEIVTRPQPRTAPDTEGNASRRDRAGGGTFDADGGPNKLWPKLDGKKLVRIVAEQALASKASEVIVVTAIRPS